MKILNPQILVDFLKTAKNCAYASSNRPIYLPDGKKIYTFTDGEFLYKDTYYANLIDSGQEVVWYRRIPVWAMSYHGGLQDNMISSKECFEFLKKALRMIPSEFTVRGPKYFHDRGFEYFNNFMGDIISFVGNEQIMKNDKNVYLKNYLGGMIRHKGDAFLDEISLQKIKTEV